MKMKPSFMFPCPTPRKNIWSIRKLVGRYQFACTSLISCLKEPESHAEREPRTSTEAVRIKPHMLSRLLPTVNQQGSLPQCSFHPWATRYHCSICGARQSFTEKLALDYCAGELFSAGHSLHEQRRPWDWIQRQSALAGGTLVFSTPDRANPMPIGNRYALICAFSPSPCYLPGSIFRDCEPHAHPHFTAAGVSGSTTSLPASTRPRIP